MNFYRLTPARDHSDDDAWDRSVYQGVCFVWAPSENWARGYADAAFRSGKPSPLGEITSDMPWRHPVYVSVRMLLEPGPSQLEGTIHIPADPHHPDGDRVPWSGPGSLP